MAKVTPISEHFQHFLGEMKETFWGDLYGQTKLAWQRFFELQSERQRDRFSGAERYERRQGRRRVYRNGYYERDFVTRFGTIRLRIARTREKSFLLYRVVGFGTGRLDARSNISMSINNFSCNSPDCRRYARNGRNGPRSLTHRV